MKKIIITITSLFILTALYGQAPSDTAIINLSPGVTNIAANTTNTTSGLIVQLPANGMARTMTIQARAAGVAATTNGVTSVSNVVFRLAVSVDGTNFTDSSQSPYKVAVPAMGYTTNWNADWMYLPGIKAIRLDRIENNTSGSVSNLLMYGSFNY